MTVAHGLADRDDVWLDPHELVAPHRGARSGVPGLDLVSDPQRPGRVRPFDELGGDRRGEIDDPIARQHRVENRGGRWMSSLHELVDATAKVFDAAVKAPQRVRRTPRPNVLGL